VHRYLCLPNQEGVSSLFVKPDPQLNGQLQRTDISGLWAITTGKLPPNPAELVGSERMSKILEVIKRHVDLVLLDTPPLMAVTDAAVLAPRVDGVLLVIKPGATRLSACRQSVEQLRRAGANVLGVVLNDVNMRSARYRYAYYRGYYHSYEKKYGAEPEPSPQAEPEKSKH
jgi:capsular exopolysaccharide synthesis family protein